MLLLFLIITAISVSMQRNLFASTMQMGIFSLFCASFFICMDAVDVAFTEATVGAGVVTLLFLCTLVQTGYLEKAGLYKRLPALVVSVLTAVLLIYGLQDIPPLGSPDSPVQQWVSPSYLQNTPTDIDVPNVVTAVLASYRSYDTMGEVVVIFTALIGVLMLLGRGYSTDELSKDMTGDQEQAVWDGTRSSL